jgi:two-component system response regulator ChvI
MPSIAIVNNERPLAKMLACNLRADGHKVRCYHRSDLALHALLQRPADLALIDCTNPPLGGIELLRRLRRRTPMPVFFLSAWAWEIEAKLAGSDLEAEDYIQCPFSLAELRARIAAVLMNT